MSYSASIEISDLRAALSEGFRDFMQAPILGLFFSAFYVLCGFALIALGAGTFTWTLVLTLGFPLVAPFAAVGLYEVSRRLENKEPLEWRAVLGVVWSERGRQTPWIGAIILMIFLFWSFFAHMLFALFLGNIAAINVSTSWQVMTTPNGVIMMAVQFAVGAGVAFLVYSVTVLSLPMVLDREVDFVTAMLTSMRVVGANLGVMLAWAALIAAIIFVSLLPAFLGLFISLPILGHATWHLYRHVMLNPATGTI